MEDLFNLELNDDTVRFTPDGRILITDAIHALAGGRDAKRVWQKIAAQNPDILEDCERHDLEDDDAVFFADMETWDRIVPLLAEQFMNGSNRSM
ncbi:conserved domain protein [delta proteobacterium NaphS2]|nr:conserved domain protein [delta proteobacterium NaphS2]